VNATCCHPCHLLLPQTQGASCFTPNAAFVSTQSSSGVGNLAPYSYFNVMAHSPPHVAIGFCASRLRSHGRKDSLVNILDTGWVGSGCMFVGG
jgi:flavin reductase (DIM6/NTAB) family NADH-FMN oxidoreductase RutF